MFFLPTLNSYSVNKVNKEWFSNIFFYKIAYADGTKYSVSYTSKEPDVARESQFAEFWQSPMDGCNILLTVHLSYC